MADKQTYKVLRQMDGDKQYYAGDTRELTEAEAKHLVDLGVIEPVEPKKTAAKAEESAPEDKAEVAPANKAEATITTSRKARK